MEKSKLKKESEKQPKLKQLNKKNKFANNPYLKYTSLAFQLVAYILVGVYLGRWIDNQLALSVPITTAFLPLLFMSGMFIKLYVELTKNDEK